MPSRQVEAAATELITFSLRIRFVFAWISVWIFLWSSLGRYRGVRPPLHNSTVLLSKWWHFNFSHRTPTGRLATASPPPPSCWRGSSQVPRHLSRRTRGRAPLASAWATTGSCRNCPLSKVLPALMAVVRPSGVDACSGFTPVYKSVSWMEGRYYVRRNQEFQRCWYLNCRVTDAIHRTEFSSTPSRPVKVNTQICPLFKPTVSEHPPGASQSF